MNRVPVVLGLLLTWVSVGCSQKARERPPFTELSCRENDCGGKGGGASPVAGGSPAPDDSALSASSEPGASSVSSAGTDAGLRSVSLDPQEAIDLQRTLGASIGLPYALYRWPDVDSPVLQSTGLGAETLTVDLHGEWLLVLVTDSADAVDPTWLPTLSWQVPALDVVKVPVFRTQFWSDLAAGLALSPTTLDPDASHVVIQVVGRNGEPLLGASGEVVSGAIAYGNGGSASDVLTETDDSGLMVWLNAPAGTGTTLTLRTETDLWSVVIPTRAATVTVAAVAQP